MMLLTRLVVSLVTAAALPLALVDAAPAFESAAADNDGLTSLYSSSLDSQAPKFKSAGDFELRILPIGPSIVEGKGSSHGNGYVYLPVSLCICLYSLLFFSFLFWSLFSFSLSALRSANRLWFPQATNHLHLASAVTSGSSYATTAGPSTMSERIRAAAWLTRT